MCYKDASKTLQKTLNRVSQNGFATGIGIKIFLLTTTGMGSKGLVPLKSRFKVFIKGGYQSDNIKVPKQKLERERDPSAFCNIQDR
jgi:hypothetical protein